MAAYVWRSAHANFTQFSIQNGAHANFCAATNAAAAATRNDDDNDADDDDDEESNDDALTLAEQH